MLITPTPGGMGASWVAAGWSQIPLCSVESGGVLRGTAVPRALGSWDPWGLQATG